MAPQDYPHFHGLAAMGAMLRTVYLTLVVATIEDVKDAFTGVKEAVTFLLEAVIPVAIYASTKRNRGSSSASSSGENIQSGVSSPILLGGSDCREWGGSPAALDTDDDSSGSDSSSASFFALSASSLAKEPSSSQPSSTVASWESLLGCDGKPVGGSNLTMLRKAAHHQSHTKASLRNARRNPGFMASTHSYLEHVRMSLHNETPLMPEQVYGLPSTQPLPTWPSSRLLKRIVRNNGALRPKVLVLDLDETLLCAVVDKQSFSKNFQKPTYHEAIPTATGATLYAVWERPHVQLFLSVMRRLYSLVLFTASLPSYADPLIDRLERSHLTEGLNRASGGRVVPVSSQQALFKQRLYRDHCTRCTVAPPLTPQCASSGDVAQRPKRAYVKDLTKLGVPLQDLIILDNKAESFALHPENGLVIKSFQLPSTGQCDDSADNQLLALIPVLTALAFVPDVRHVLRMHLPSAHQ